MLVPPVEKVYHNQSIKSIELSKCYVCLCVLLVAVYSPSPRGVIMLFLCDKHETDMREIAVLRFLCIGCCERSEQ